LWWCELVKLEALGAPMDLRRLADCRAGEIWRRERDVAA
jgi:hypothetical protein